VSVEEKSIGTIRDHHVIQIFVFRGEEYLGWDCFHKDSIAIGRSSSADLVLDDKSIAAFQAIVSLIDGTIGVDLFESKSNQKKTVRPGQFDSIEIGPYTLKIKLKGVSNQIEKKEQPIQEKEKPPIQKKLMKIEEIKPLNTQPETKQEKQDATPEIDCDKPADVISELSVIEEDPATDYDQTLIAECGNDLTENTLKKEQDDTDNDTSINFLDWEDDEDDDEDIEACFSLRDKVLEQSNSKTSIETIASKELLIEVIKTKYDKVCDISFLSGNQKYIIGNNDRFCLAENKKGAGQFVYFQGQHKGQIRPDNSTQQSLETLCTPEHVFHKRKRIYRYQLPVNGIAVIYDHPFEYRLKSVQPGASPVVRETEKNNNTFFKHLVKSSVLHLFFLIFVGLFPGFKPPEKPIESHFVRIDTNEIAKFQKKIHPQPPKTLSSPKKTKPVIDKRKVTTAKKTKKIKAKRHVASRHPKAGGGFGKGNIKNRDVNQAGILSMLGSSVGLKPGEAMAAVTNLDAISNTTNTRGNFKISGITGKLGNGRIEMPKSDIIATKGSHQVLRSAGVGGKGRVAALKKGKTGENQVMAMVTASLNKKVRIQGGMSREAVKKVIDMHMDEISHCYETALVDNPSIVGRVVFEWKILLSGKVGEVRIQNSSINSDYIHSCIQSRIKSWQFPKPQGNQVMVSYPFIFDVVGF